MKDIIKLGIELLDRIEKLHDIGILHLDIKADNILNGPKLVSQLSPFQNNKSDQSQVYLIDFGKSCSYIIDSTKEHVKNIGTQYFEGNWIFASANLLNG